MVWSQYRLPGTVYVPLGFGVVLFAKVCFFLPAQFCKAVDFTLALLYTNFKQQYLIITAQISIMFADSDC